jgi:hypothetical protein
MYWHTAGYDASGIGVAITIQCSPGRPTWRAHDIICGFPTLAVSTPKMWRWNVCNALSSESVSNYKEILCTSGFRRKFVSGDHIDSRLRGNDMELTERTVSFPRRRESMPTQPRSPKNQLISTYHNFSRNMEH